MAINNVKSGEGVGALNQIQIWIEEGTGAAVWTGLARGLAWLDEEWIRTNVTRNTGMELPGTSVWPQASSDVQSCFIDNFTPP